MPLVTGNMGVRFAAVVAFAVTAALAGLSGTRPAASTSAPARQAATDAQSAGNFSHRTYSHSRLACNTCHQRSDNSIAGKFPGHSACTNCHAAQFVNPQEPMCALCHANLASVPPPLKGFPTKFVESFNLDFDHAQHNQGSARPANGCASCHAGNVRRGAAMSIPAGLTAHNNCYSCHSAGSTSAFGRDISGCSTCHAAAGYRRTPTSGLAFGIGFSHATHGPKQKLGCADCHTPAAKRPLGQQVSSTSAAEHFPSSKASSCATCHNGKRAFGELTDCKKCHTGPTFTFRGGG